MAEDRVRRFERRLADHAGRVIYAMATAFQAEAKKDLSVPNPAPHKTPAPKGAWPRMRTGTARDGVSLDRSLAECIATGEVRVGITKPGGVYIAALARKGWKGLKDSYLKARPRLLRLRKFLGG